jgi:predicted nucleic acid-binding protein
MPDEAILDTGVIVAIYFKEEGSIRAKKVAMEHHPITVDWAFAEAGNAAWKRVAIFGKDKDATWASLSKCFEYINSCDLLAASELASVAFQIAVEDKIAFYDALFVAASELKQVPLYTLDKKLYEMVKGKRNVRMV